jgi:hypothetical protein
MEIRRARRKRKGLLAVIELTNKTTEQKRVRPGPLGHGRSAKIDKKNCGGDNTRHGGKTVE